MLDLKLTLNNELLVKITYLEKLKPNMNKYAHLGVD